MQFGCLIETRVRESRAQRIISTVFPNWSAISNYEHKRLGRLWVVWSPEVRITPCFKSSQMITCSVLLQGMTEEFMCSFIYASNSADERRELWNDLKDHQNTPLFKNKPWMVVGDYNEILDMEEYVGSAPPAVTMGMREFQDMARHCSFIDMKAHGPQLTWSNKRKDGLIQKKLDRTLVNDVWLTKFPQTYCVFEAGGCSDHLRCRILFLPEKQKPKRPFKFINVVAELPGFLSRLDTFWKDTTPLHISTSALFRFSKKLKDLKPAMRELSKENIGDITKRTREAYENLCRCQTNTMTNPTNQLIEDEARAYEKWSLLSSIEEKVLSQKAKMHWLKIGDGNNKSFHNSAKIRAAKNSIFEIQKTDGSTISTQEGIKKEAVEYYDSFLNHNSVGYTGMSVDDLNQLLQF
ncbi:hypothetical protein N665_2441s0005 [Sinapis alba]|nr:hypothetical protein N665_2441s0005 [Sinapis alba]